MQLKKIQILLDQAKPQGWVLEPDAKTIFTLSGMAVPRFIVAREAASARAFADHLGYPVVAKIVSPDAVHKSDIGGVVTGIGDGDALAAVFARFSNLPGFGGMLVEEMLTGTELIVGGKVDEQFGPVVLLGMGGVGVEIYKDTVVRMAPIKENDVYAMIDRLTAGKLFHGFRGQKGLDLTAIAQHLTRFSTLLIKTADRIDSMEINPLICTPGGCVAADARIILKIWKK